MACVLVTGSAKRIGLGIVTFFAEKGYNIAMHCNESINIANAEAKKIEERYGVKCKVFSCDLSNTESIQFFFEEIISVFEKIDILINNASFFEQSSIFDITLEEVMKNFSLHLFSPLFLCQAFAKQYDISDGIIINILDKNITRKKTKYLGYLHSKKALWELTQYLAVVLAPNIRTNAISPGFIIPEKDSFANEKYMQNKFVSIPLEKQGSIDNILQGIDYIITNDYVNGQNLFVDGGAWLLN